MHGTADEQYLKIMYLRKRKTFGKDLTYDLRHASGSSVDPFTVLLHQKSSQWKDGNAPYRVWNFLIVCTDFGKAHEVHHQVQHGGGSVSDVRHILKTDGTMNAEK